jgi:omega-amidase
MSTLRIALGQYDTGWEDPKLSLERAAQVVQHASAAGAQLVALPETATSGWTMQSDRFAESLEGDTVNALIALARKHRMHILAGVPTRDGDGFYNSALMIGSDGELLANYRKQRLFAMGGEDGSYQPGMDPVVVEVGGVRIAPFICYELRFPELFRPVAAQVDAMILIANWPVQRRMHWDILSQARAIENQCYFVSVNRIGPAGGAQYDGGSVAFSPWGELLAAAGDRDATQSAIVVTIDSAEVARVRERYPFLQDCRVAADVLRV